MKKKTTIQTLNDIKNQPGIKKKKNGNHPFKKNIVIKQHIIKMLEYSDRKNKTKVVAAYSTLKPETSSDSASGKSKGTLFVSAKAAIKNINKLGQKGITKKTLV